jgi:hypothetical protein
MEKPFDKVFDEWLIGNYTPELENASHSVESEVQ